MRISDWSSDVCSSDLPGTSYAAMASPSGLTMIAGYADGIGPNKVMVIPRATLGRLGKPTALVRDAHAAGLKVHPWTFRRENYFLPLGDKASINPAEIGRASCRERVCQ